MKPNPETTEIEPLSSEETTESLDYSFALNRRAFVQVLGAGLLISTVLPVLAQQRSSRGNARPQSVASRIHLGQDGVITVLTGKIEMGQGARAELSQAAAEELRVPVSQIQMIMGDTALVPDDGITAGSRTTPSTLPAVRQGAAAARQLLVELACRRWGVESATVEARDGKITHASSQRVLTYAELAQNDAAKIFDQAIPGHIEVTPVAEWKVLGSSVPRPNRRDIVTGVHLYPSDYTRPGMLYGKILRPPSYGARLVSIDLSPAKAMEEVVVLRESAFVGVAAPSTFRANQALRAIAETAQWESAPHPSSREIFEYLRKQVKDGPPKNPFSSELAQAHKVVRQIYQVPYVQHAPMETRAALAEWTDGKLTVWTGTQNPFGYQREIAAAFGLPMGQVRVIVPDFGGGFGGKHTAEAAIEAARLAKAAGRPVRIHWTRQEEFTWAYFRPAALIEAEASIDSKGGLTSWHFININSGAAAVNTPYRAGQTQCRFVGSNSPLRQGSYRVLAATANVFARECFMDELAAAAGLDPLDFRLAHLEEPRLRAVLEEAAKRFHWRERIGRKNPGTGLGLACGTEKNSVVAACVEITLDRERKQFRVNHICEVFECGAIINPDNLMAQVKSCIIMGLGPALREEMIFENGQIQNASFGQYRVPRFADLPEMDIHLLNRPDITSVGAGETPIVPVAPAIANALFHATGVACHEMPVRAPGAAPA